MYESVSQNDGYLLIGFVSCFFFQAEDGIRDGTVTGVQTCALPIYSFVTTAGATAPSPPWDGATWVWTAGLAGDSVSTMWIVFRSSLSRYSGGEDGVRRSEERRVGKECRSRWEHEQQKKNTHDGRGQ